MLIHQRLMPFFIFIFLLFYYFLLKSFKVKSILGTDKTSLHIKSP